MVVAPRMLAHTLEWLFLPPPPNHYTNKAELPYFLCCLCFIKWNKQGDDGKDRQTGVHGNSACDEHLKDYVSCFDEEEGHLAISAFFFLKLCIYPLIYYCMKNVYTCVLS